MLKHYLTTALRNFRRHKMTTAISVFGLTLGLVCFIGAFVAAYILTHTDRGFAKSGRTFFIETHIGLGQNGSITTPTNSWRLAQYLPAEFPELEAVARLTGGQPTGIYADGKTVQSATSYADPAFLRIFDLPFLTGDSEHALDRPRSAVISEATAQKLFGTADVVGRTIVVHGLDLTVTGIYREIPAPSHLKLVLSVDTLLSSDVEDELAKNQANAVFRTWSGQSYFTYVLLPDSKTLPSDVFNQRLSAFSARVVPKAEGKYNFSARPVSEVGATLASGFTHSDQSGISGTLLLTVLGSAIAAIACLNYANLMAAQIVGRIKEIGLRKVLGAEHSQLIAQYLLETGLQVLASYATALLLLVLGAPVVAHLLGFDVLGFLAIQPASWAFLGVSVVAVTLIAGFYPALAVLRITPDVTARLKETSRRQLGTRILVSLQFGAVSLLLIVALVILSENRAIRAGGLIVGTDPIVVISSRLSDVGVSIDALRAELQSARSIKSVSALRLEPWSMSTSSFSYQRALDRSAAPFGANYHEVGDDFFATMDIRLLAGRGFSAEHGEDLSRADEAARNVIVDRTFAASLGWSPNEAIGKTIFQIRSADGTKPPRPINIIGVAENKPFKLITFAGALNLYEYNPNGAGIALVRVDRNDISAGLAAIDAAWARLAPTIPLRRRFMDDIFRESYTIFSAGGTIIFALAAFAFSIAAAGLVGMATYAVTRLRREIAIRKALGSTVQRALRLILWDFSKPVVIANVIAWPVAFLASQVYLSLFMTRIALTPVPFVLGFLIALLMTWAAVGWHAWRAARVNPAEVLHYE